jgi:asparagine synthase (glutamine-hydrolysing)
MCGVAGIYAYHYASNPVDRSELIRIRDYMHRRGPDAEGAWLSDNGHAGLGHRRLSIIDLDPRANQPMSSEDGSLVISFNGEIYNYEALRQKLEVQGCRFRTQSDTEVLLQMYRLHGDQMFAQLRGMYAFALWDAQKKAMLLARDPYGIKPLYYADDGWSCRFASQVKALLAGGKVSKGPEPAGIVGFYLLGSVPEPYTLYQEIRSVPAGSYVWITSIGAHNPVQHFSIPKIWADAHQHRHSREGGTDSQIRAALLDSVRHHLVADVPVGAFLSSGIDSSALVGLMRDAGQQNIKTVTVAFDEFLGKAEDEALLAADTARAYVTDHQVRRVTKAEFLADLPRILEAMDQPSIDGINMWFVAKATAERGLKVAVSGLGGDELFGGYATFRDVPRWVSLLRLPSQVPGAGRALRALLPLIAPRSNPKARGLLSYGGNYTGAWFLKRGLFMPWELQCVLDPDTVREGLRRLRLQRHLDGLLQPDPGTAFARVSTLESALYMRNQLLRDTDWASMAHSLEVRVPLVDAFLLPAIAAHVAAGDVRDKSALIASPAQPLLASIVHRAKTGFSIPVAHWLQQDHDISHWRNVPELVRPNTPWARRWSHIVGSQFGDAAAKA